MQRYASDDSSDLEGNFDDKPGIHNGDKESRDAMTKCANMFIDYRLSLKTAHRDTPFRNRRRQTHRASVRVRR